MANESIQSKNPSYGGLETALPPGWCWVSLGDVTATMKNGIYRPASSYADEGIPCLRMYNIDQGKIVWRDIKRMTLTEDEIEEYELLPGDLLLNRVNSRELVGKAVAIPANFERCVFESKNIRVRLKQNVVVPEYVGYRLLAEGSYHFMRNAQQVVGMASINQSQVASFPLPLAPINEQRRIVAEIEKQFTRLDAGVEALRHIQVNLKRYRAAVLKAACEGSLTLSDSSLWLKTTISESVKIIDYRGRTPPFSESGIPHLRSQNIRNGKIVWSGLAFVTSESYQAFMTRGLPEDGDLLFTTEAPVGEVALAPTEKFCVAQRIMILRGKPEVWNSRFLMAQLRSVEFQARLRESSTGSTVAGVSARNFRPMTLFAPPLAEQTRIVAEMERRLSVVEELEAMVSSNLQRSMSMRRGILQKAFCGQLVDQAAGDETADAMLKRANEEPIPAKQTLRKSNTQRSKSMPPVPIDTLDQLLTHLDALGGSVAPNRLLMDLNLGNDVERFFDLLRDGRDKGALLVPTGESGTIRRVSHAS